MMPAAVVRSATVPLPVALRPVNPLFYGGLGTWSGIRLVHPIERWIERDHDARTVSLLDQGWSTGRIVWPERWPRGIP